MTNKRLAGLLFCCVLLQAGCASTPLRDPSSLPDFAASLTTEDGWRLSLFRVPAAGERGGGQPVVLAPGLGLNSRSFRFPGSDLAGYLAKEGFEVWLLEPRGAVSSRAPTQSEWKATDEGLQSVVEQDVGAVLSYIEQTSGGQPPFWLGHGLGANLGLAAAREGRLRGLVGLGMIADFAVSTRFHRRFEKRPAGLPARGHLPLRGLGTVVGRSMHLAPDADLLHSLFNEDNLSGEVVAEFSTSGLEDIRRGVVEDLRRRIRDPGGAPPTWANISATRVPALLIAGRVDPLAPVWEVERVYDNWTHEDKSLVILGRGWGSKFDYGHLDLVLGDGLRDEVFGVISEWLLARIPDEVEAAKSPPDANAPASQ